MWKIINETNPTKRQLRKCALLGGELWRPTLPYYVDEYIIAGHLD